MIANDGATCPRTRSSRRQRPRPRKVAMEIERKKKRRGGAHSIAAQHSLSLPATYVCNALRFRALCVVAL
jgi:hypothetical protein